MTKTARKSLIKLLDQPTYGMPWFAKIGNQSFVTARLGKDERPVKRFTPPLPVEYWREKNTLENNVRGYITNGVYHRSHVERFAGTHPA